MKPDFKWIESATKYKRAYTDDYGNNWMEQVPNFVLDYGLKEDWQNSCQACIPIKYNKNYRLTAYWWLLKIIYEDGFSRRIFKQGKR